MSDGALSCVWAVVPVKAFARGKSRLSGVLRDGVRAAFARGLFEHVIGTLRSSKHIAHVLIVTEDDEVAEAARAHGLSVLRDPTQAGLANVVDAGLRHAHAAGASAGFVCMADLPHLSVAEVDEAIELLTSADVVVTPDLVRAGTNVLCQSPATRMASCFGRQDSFAQHVARATAEGLVLAVIERPGLCFDVDDPSDLEKVVPSR